MLMKTWNLAVVIATVAALFVGLSVSTSLGKTDSLQVSEIAICKDVVDLKCVEPGYDFSPNVGKLFCFTRIKGAQEPTKVTHVWYFGATERARVELEVNSPNWRTYSSKIIQAHEVGIWTVVVLGPGGHVLENVHFEISKEG